MAHHILPLLPPHTVYVEPFCGGAALLFAKPLPVVAHDYDHREVLNDHDERIMAVYRVCQDEAMRYALLEKLAYTPYGRAAYEESRTILKCWPIYPPITQAWAVLVSIQQSMNNKLGSGWGVARTSTNGAALWKHWQERLASAMSRLSGVYLECDDALAVIKRWDSPQTCFYCDPPYPGTDQGHYRGYLDADLKALVEVLDICQGSFCLSGYVSTHMPPDWEQFNFSHTAKSCRDISRRGRTEYVWRVDRSAGMRPELKAIVSAKGPAPLSLFDD